MEGRLQLERDLQAIMDYYRALDIQARQQKRQGHSRGPLQARQPLPALGASEAGFFDGAREPREPSLPLSHPVLGAAGSSAELQLPGHEPDCQASNSDTAHASQSADMRQTELAHAPGGMPLQDALPLREGGLVPQYCVNLHIWCSNMHQQKARLSGLTGPSRATAFNALVGSQPA